MRLDVENLVGKFFFLGQLIFLYKICIYFSKEISAQILRQVNNQADKRGRTPSFFLFFQVVDD